MIDDKDRIKAIWNIAYPKMEADAKKHIYTHSFSNFYYEKMKESEKTIRKDDLLFCGVPHLFIAHERCVGKWAEDSKVNCMIAPHILNFFVMLTDSERLLYFYKKIST